MAGVKRLERIVGRVLRRPKPYPEKKGAGMDYDDFALYRLKVRCVWP